MSDKRCVIKPVCRPVLLGNVILATRAPGGSGGGKDIFWERVKTITKSTSKSKYSVCISALNFRRDFFKIGVYFLKQEDEEVVVDRF